MGFSPNATMLPSHGIGEGTCGGACQATRKHSFVQEGCGERGPFARAVRARVRIARVRVDGAGGDARDDARRDDGGGINVPTDDDDE